MIRTSVLFLFAAIILSMQGCGGSGSGGNGGGGGNPANSPTLIAIAPASATVGSPALSLVAFGSNFSGSTSIQWNGSAILTNCVDTNWLPVSCDSATALTATIPATDLASAGSASVTLVNRPTVGNSGGTSKGLNFTISQPPAGSTWVRAISGISVPNDMVWDSAHGRLYATVNSTDPANANSIAVIDPVAGAVTSFVPAAGNPDQLSISSDSQYLWTGLDGSGAVQRFLLPGMSQDISFPVPADWKGAAQIAVSLQAAPTSPHTVALIAGYQRAEFGGDGVYVYDDATARANHVRGLTATQGPGPDIDWIQWGADDKTLYGNPGISRMHVDRSGVTLSNQASGVFLPSSLNTQYSRSNGLLYDYGGAYDPGRLSMRGSFDLPITGAEACTADGTLGRYYCVTTLSQGGTDVTALELWVFDLKSYALLNRVYFGAVSTGSSQSAVTGAPAKLVRWGNAGLAVLTNERPYDGNGGVFLIDGAAVNPNATPDVTKGTASDSYAWLSSMSPDAATTASGEVAVTIKGQGFSPDSTACWNCNYLQFTYLPTTYVSPTQLRVTIPLASVSATGPLEISVFDPGTDLFSSNALTFSILPSSGATQVLPVNLCGLAAAWDEITKLLYVATADYDGAHPNSVVALDPNTGTVLKSQRVEADPVLLSDSANGDYLYVGYAGATDFTQLALPGLNPTFNAPLKNNPAGSGLLAGDLKAAPQDSHTVAATLIIPGYSPEALGGVVIYDDGTPRPTSLPGWTGGQTVPALYDLLAWSASDQLLTSAPSVMDAGTTGPLYLLAVDPSGVSYLSQSAVFDTGGAIQSDFGTNLIYSDGGRVADPNTGAIVGNFGASGLVAPDSSLNRVFILGQTFGQSNTNSFTIESFDQKAFTPVSSITLDHLSGSPIALVRWGSTGLAVLTVGGLGDLSADGLGMLYLVQDSAFVSNTESKAPLAERVQQRWKRMTVREHLARVHQAAFGNVPTAR